jgi:hypothetical protein
MRSRLLAGFTTAFCCFFRNLVLDEILQNQFLDVGLVGEDVARDF